MFVSNIDSDFTKCERTKNTTRLFFHSHLNDRYVDTYIHTHTHTRRSLDLCSIRDLFMMSFIEREREKNW